jgi:hypothetical protein
MSSNLNHLKAGVITTRVTNLISLDLFRKLLLRFGLLLALVVFIIARSWGQTTTVAYTQQLDQYDQSLTTSGSGGIFNNGSTEVGMWMNGDNSSNGFAGNVLWKTFRVGSATSNTTRSLQVGDEFTIRVSTRGAYYGTIGISFNSGSIPTATWGNRISNRRISVQQDGGNFGSGGGRGSFYYNNGNTTGSFSVTPNSERSDYTIKLKLTAPDRCNITVGCCCVNGQSYSLTEELCAEIQNSRFFTEPCSEVDCCKVGYLGACCINKVCYDYFSAMECAATGGIFQGPNSECISQFINCCTDPTLPTNTPS